MLIDQLQKEIKYVNERLAPEADTAIMHPDTFNEIFGNKGTADVVILNGCTIYRSEDVPKNQFVVR